MRRDEPDLARTVNREVVVLAGWGRALLLQLAHPRVAEAVATHGGFLAERRGRWARLRRTIDAMLALTFGAPEEAARVAARINAIHRRVGGATDPRLLRWVHATFVDSALAAYATFVRPLSLAERDRYCAEAARAESLLEMPAGCLPRSAGDLARYVGEMLAGGEIAVSGTARALARVVIDPVGVPVVRSLLAPARLPTVGLLPPVIREAYGLPWSPARQRALDLAASVVRATLPAVPPLIRHWPASRRAGRARRPAPALFTVF